MFTKVGKSVKKAAIVDKNGHKWANKDKSGHRVGKKWAENGHGVGKSGQKSKLTYGSS